jgi:uncharacterized protein
LRSANLATFGVGFKTSKVFKTFEVLPRVSERILLNQTRRKPAFRYFCTMKHLFIFSFFLASASIFAQQKFDRLAAESFQTALNAEYLDNEKSPLMEKDKADFKGHQFFPIDEKYFVTAEFVRTENEKPFAMKTSTQRLPMYEKYGELHFSLDGRPQKLNVYRSLDLMQKEAFKDYLFLPFSDTTNGNETYLGGRYIDLKIPQGNTIAIDFNQAYNPYCAYNYKYSCPAVPQENVLNIAVRAGVKKFHD